MTTPQAMEEKFWEALRSDMTLMLGLNGVKDGHTRPMTAQLDGNGDRGPIWFFTVKDTLLAKDLENGNRAIATFVSKNHDVFATIHGALSVDSDRAAIDRLWNSHVAAWYESGKDDPALMLLRLDAETAEIWLDASSFVAGVKALFGVDPKKDYKDNMAKVSFP